MASNKSFEDAKEILKEIDELRQSRLHAKSMNKSKAHNNNNNDHNNLPTNAQLNAAILKEVTQHYDEELSSELFNTPTKTREPTHNTFDYTINNPNSFLFQAEQITRQLDNVLMKIASDKKKC